MSYKTLSAILKGKWLIDPQSAKSYLPLLNNVLTGTTVFEQHDNELNIQVFNQGVLSSHKHSAASGTYQGSKPAQITLVIPISGPLMKNDQECGPVGMMTIANFVNQVSQDEQVGTLIFEIDSPGGQVDGTQTLVDAIKNSGKKTIGYINDGMACSAGYWIASACSELYASRKTDVVGSIGVYCTLADFKAYYEKEGLKIHEIYSRLSSEKNKDYKDAMDGDYKGVEDGLDFIAKEFIDSVKANRPGINLSKGDPFKGATFYSDQALEIGLIDGIKSLNEILNMENNNNQAGAGAPGAENNASIVNSGDVNQPVMSNETVAAFITALDPIRGMSDLNAALASSKLKITNAEEFSALEAEAVELREYKTTNEAWLQANDLSHTTGKAKIDSFKGSEGETGDGMSETEKEYLAKNYGL